MTSRSGLLLSLVAGLLVLSLPTRAQLKGAERLLQSVTRVQDAYTPPPQPSDAPIQIRIEPYFGWERSLLMSNGQVEVLIVPAIGRVMQFRFIGRPSPFWEDPALRGRSPNPESREWGNFGGDKSWPAPQADWDKITHRAWPPPVAFDSMPVEASFRRDTIVLTSPVDPHYGIRSERVISLLHDAPTMTIVTTYEKVAGPPHRVGVWVITQLDDPIAVFAPLPNRSLFPEGYNRQSGDQLPAGLQVTNGLLSLRRDPARSTKIGLDTDRLLWVGSTQMLLVESPRQPGLEYPDAESSAEIYTNPDPKTYVELEMLGPLRTLAPGNRLSQTNIYSLHLRQSPDPVTDARRILHRLP